MKGPREKTRPGNFFEDFHPGAELVHATPRTVTEGDAAVYQSLFGSRFAVQSSAPFAASVGCPRAPVDSLLVFHLVFGKTVPDISLNAVANLGYADGRFGVPVYPGDTLRAVSRVVGVKANRDGATGVVWVRSRGTNQRDETVCEFTRWVMVRKRDAASPAPEPVVPALPDRVAPETLDVPFALGDGSYDAALAGSPFAWEDYAVGERIDHMDAMTVEEAEHMAAARLFQNAARVHFNLHVEREGRFGQRIVYGGYLISLARALSFNGLGNAFAVVGLNGGRHVNPTFAGNTVYAWSEILETAPLPGRSDLGALRVRSVATRDRACDDFPYRDADGTYDAAVVLDLDYWVVIPTRRAMG